MGVSGGNDIVWKVGSDVADFSMGVATMKSGLTDFATATSKDFSSGLVRELVKIEQQAKVMKGEITAAQLAAERFTSMGGSSELVRRYQAAADQIQGMRAAEEEAANVKRSLYQEMEEVTRQAIESEQAARAAAMEQEKTKRSEVIQHNLKQQQLIDQHQKNQQSIDDRNVQSQLAAIQQAAAVKRSVMTNEATFAQERLRLQGLHNRGLLTELELQKAIGSARTAAMSRRAGGGVPLGFIAQQGAIGLQDAVTGYQTNGWSGAIMSGGNNLVQMLSLVNPLAGTAGALGLAAVQMGVAWSKAKSGAEEAKKAFEEAKKAASETSSMLSQVASASAGKFEADILSAANAKGEEVSRLLNLKGKIELEVLVAANEGDQNKVKALSGEVEEVQNRIRMAEREKFLLENDARNAAVGSGDVAGLSREENEKLKRQQAYQDRIQSDIAKRQKEEQDALRQVAEEERRVQADLTRQRLADAKAVRDALKTPQQRAQDETDRLLKMEAYGDIGMGDVRATISRLIQGSMAGPQIAQGLVKGSVEEVRARRMDEARTAQDRMVEKQTEQLIESRKQTSELERIREQVRSYPTGSEA